MFDASTPAGVPPEDAKLADEHTFHYTNAAPQAQSFNGGEWLDIEDYVLGRSQAKDRKMTIFTGPVFHKRDPELAKMDRSQAARSASHIGRSRS